MNYLSLSNKRVLVTGAGGFIGSHLSEKLGQIGAKVRAFVRYNSRNDYGLLNLLPREILDDIEIVAGDLRDTDAMMRATADIDVVFHLGAVISIPYSYQHPTEVAEINVMGTLNILTACLAQNVSRLIHTSTSEVYGTALRVPIDESHPLQGQSPYSASKIGADKLVESFYRTYELPTVTVRPFNTYGPRQSARAVIPTIISQALFQDRIKLGNLEARRDFNYVGDTVAGFLHAAAGSDDVLGREINLGTGQDISIRDLAQEIIDLVDRPVKIELDRDRLRPQKSEVMRLISDNSLAEKALQWQPQVSLTKGLQETIEWIKTHRHYFRAGIYEV